MCIRDRFDAAWLCFENFEGVESKLEGLDVKKLYLEDVEIPNFCALDVFASKSFASANKNLVNDFKSMTQESIKILSSDLDYSKSSYYAYTKTKPTSLMDNIIKDTTHRFKNPFNNSNTLDLAGLVSKKYSFNIALFGIMEFIERGLIPKPELLIK